jgi:hypothetical protein
MEKAGLLQAIMAAIDKLLQVKKASTAILLGSACVLGGGWLGDASHAAPSARGFICGISGGAPSTNAVKSDGKQVAVIRWTSNRFDSAGWTPERRCQEVSARFDQYFKEGRLKYLTTGRMNGVPVICTALNQGGACDGLLYTLKPGQNATATLESLLEVRNKATGPLNETSSRRYISLDQILNKDQASSGVSRNEQRQTPNALESPLF